MLAVFNASLWETSVFILFFSIKASAATHQLCMCVFSLKLVFIIYVEKVDKESFFAYNNIVFVVRRHSQGVRQRSAKPLSPVQIWVAPPKKTPDNPLVIRKVGSFAILPIMSMHTCFDMFLHLFFGALLSKLLSK